MVSVVSAIRGYWFVSVLAETGSMVSVGLCNRQVPYKNSFSVPRILLLRYTMRDTLRDGWNVDLSPFVSFSQSLSREIYLVLHVCLFIPLY